MAGLRECVVELQHEIETLRNVHNGAAPVRNGAETAAAPSAPAAIAPPTAPASKSSETETAPPYLRIGSAYITPVGFVDFTNVWRSTNPGSGIGTNFGGIPFANVSQGRIAEERMSLQNSRIGARLDALVNGAHVMGYWESDFLGSLNATRDAAISSNSDVFRLRLFWVDVRKARWELLGGQSWSLLTPGRSGISPLPADLFYTQDIDVNYQAGLTWARQPQLRVVYHPSNAVAMAVSFESPEQYVGGSSGGGAITLPAALASVYGTQLNNGTTALSAPNAHPDIAAKIAYDHRNKFNFEVGGVARTMRVYDSLVNRHFSATGGGVQANVNFEVAPGLRIVSNNYWSDGGGRYIFGQAPDVIARPDGSLSLVHSSSTVSGFEFTHKRWLIYGYYGGIYIGSNAAADGNGALSGYGYVGAPSSQNRAIQEATLGFTHTFWNDPRYGAVSFMAQYSYLSRSPWAVAAGKPNTAQTNMVFLDLRYTLPGGPPELD